MTYLPTRYSAMLAAVAVALVPVGASLKAVTATPIVSGLRTPTKTALTSQGNLLVAEAGTGPNTGRVSLVDPTTGARRTIVDGLPSGLAAPNMEPSGPSSLLVQGRTIYLLIGSGDVVVNGTEPMTTLPNPRPSSPLLASLLAIQVSADIETIQSGFVLTSTDHAALKSGARISRDGGAGSTLTLSLVADFDDYVAEPRPNQPDNVRASNPFGLTALGNRLFMVDASMNNLRSIDLSTGAVRTVTTFAPLPNTRGIGPPVVEAVPDSVRTYGNQLLVTLLTGFPFPMGGAQVLAVDPVTGTSVPFITGLTSAIDILPLQGGGFLTLEYTADMLAGATAPPSGRMQWFSTPTAAPVVVGNTFSSPTRLELDDRTGSVFITEIFAGRIGRVSPWSVASLLTPAQSGPFSNLAVRGVAGSGPGTLMGGFTIVATSRPVLVRGVGPRLESFGVTGALADPKIVVYDSAGRVVAENDNWAAGGAADVAQLTEAAAKAGAFPLGADSKDAALLKTLPPGSYTAHVTGVGGAAGVALVEVYQVP